MRFSLVFALTGIALALCGAAHAQQQARSASFRVSATVLDTCEVTAPDFSFGHNAARAESGPAGTATVAIRCAPETAYTVALKAGAAANQRQMPEGANQLKYQLYQDPGRSRGWDNSPGTDTVAGAGTGQSVDHTVFGALPARRVIPAGEYGDTVTVQVYF